MNCPLCQSTDTSVFFKSRLDWSLRSDWTALPTPAQVQNCNKCGYIFKSPELTKKWSDYQNYNVLENNPEMDKMDFSSAIPVSRSLAIIDFLRKTDHLNEDTKVLDYGCNRGAFVALLPQKLTSGFDVSEHYRPIIEGLGCRYYTPQSPPPKSHFNLLTLVHVAEHLDPLAGALRPGLEALVDSGAIFIQVPDIANQPTDLYVMDHCSHFFPETLDAMMAHVGLRNIHPVTRILSGELTAVYEKSTSVHNQKYNKLNIQNSTTSSLKNGEEILLDLQKKPGPYIVYGAGLLGSLVLSVLKNNVIAYVDDSPSLQGKKISGIPVYSLNQISTKQGTLVVAVPPSAARRVEDRCKKQGYNVLAPFKI